MPTPQESGAVENRLVLVAEGLDQAVADLQRLVQELKGELLAATEHPKPQASEGEQR